MVKVNKCRTCVLLVENFRKINKDEPHDIYYDESPDCWIKQQNLNIPKEESIITIELEKNGNAWYRYWGGIKIKNDNIDFISVYTSDPDYAPLIKAIQKGWDNHIKPKVIELIDCNQYTKNMFKRKLKIP